MVSVPHDSKPVLPLSRYNKKRIPKTETWTQSREIYYFFLWSASFFLNITLLIFLCIVITVDIAGAREVLIILKNGSQ